MRNLLLIAAAMASTLVAGAAWACSCIRFDSAADQFAQAEVMLVGRVLSTVETSPQQAVTRFEVLRGLKGPHAGVVEIRHTVNDGGAACGVQFEIGQTTPVIAFESDGHLQTNLCSMPQFPLQDFEALQGELG